MNNLTFITGNQHKADYLAKWLGLEVPHHKLDLDEIQSLDVREVVEHKVRQAYAIMQQPVLVEDVTLTFVGLGQLPGTFIKWFLQELEPAGLCKLADGLNSRAAIAGIMYGYFDGTEVRTFEARVQGVIAEKPRFSESSGWHSANSWNSIFIPEGSHKTYGEMTDDELKPFSHRAQAIEKLRTFLAE
jgi:non-canonical purine NTP pyrophosphatase (RdgB/HAM1 family)